MSQTQNLAVIGAQWGDEGKGKIVDLLSEDFDIVARYHGGHNAGHTVKFADRHFSLHLIPSGILHPRKLCVLGNGMVIDPAALLREIEELRSAGVVIENNLKISESAHCILPYHAALDVAREEAAGAAKIGTTGRGIGPAYETKAARSGVQMGDLLDEQVLREKIALACREKNILLEALYGKKPFDVEELVQSSLRHGEILRERITNTTALVNDAISDGRRILFEGAQGTLLDLDQGTYPFVTSSSCVSASICTGLGVAPHHIGAVIGVAKAYTTRVGSGPFPTELNDQTADRLRTRGNEFGTTTGRPRRTGWLDLVVLRAARTLDGLDAIALTKLDVFDDFEEIEVCVGYRIGGKVWKTFPSFEIVRGNCELEYRRFKGWNRSTVGTETFEDLPQAARDYVRFIEDELEVPAFVVSTGPRREETIIRPNPWTGRRG